MIKEMPKGIGDVGDAHPDAVERNEPAGEDGMLLDEERLEMDEMLDDRERVFFATVLKIDLAGKEAGDCGLVKAEL